MASFKPEHHLHNLRELARVFEEEPRFLVSLRAMLAPGSTSVSLALSVPDITVRAGRPDALEVEMLAGFGLLMSYRDLPTTHPMSATSRDALTLTPYAFAWLHATDEVLRPKGRPFLEWGVHAVFTYDRDTGVRKAVKQPSWRRVPSVHVSRNIHAIAARVAARCAIEEATRVKK